MNPYLMLAIAVLLLIVAILRQIDWKRLAAKWVGRDIKKAQIYVESGGVVEPIPGVQDKDNPLVYHWREGKKNDKTVALPPNYPEEYLKTNGRRIIGVKDGLPVASPLGYMPEKLVQNIIENSTDLDALINGTVVIRALRSIHTSKPFNWAMVVIIGVVAVVGLYMWNQNKKPVDTNPPAAQTTTTEPPMYEIKTTVIP